MPKNQGHSTRGGASLILIYNGKTKNMYSWLLKNVVLRIAEKAMGTSISGKLKTARKMSDWSREEIEDWQLQKLRALIHHAYNNTRYYKRVFDEHGLTPSSIQTKSDLAKVPILTKKDIRENFEEIVPLNIKSISHKKASTGGSTGEPLRYYLDHESWSFTNANTINNWERTSYRYGDKYIALGSTSLFVEKRSSYKHRIYYKLKNKIGWNGINMSDRVCRDYIGVIRKERVRYLYG
ncbi:MAG: hypothetical protein ACKVJC_11460, partial [Flavobacteriales bacterium]